MNDFSYERDGIKVTKKTVDQKTTMIKPEQPKVQTRPANDLYRENYDAIFRKPKAKKAKKKVACECGEQCACDCTDTSKCTCGHDGDE